MRYWREIVKMIYMAGTLAVVALSLAACGGGGGGGTGGGGGILPTGGPSSTPAITTTATGRVVSDTDGSPIAGVRVALRPWAACTTPTPTSVSCPTPLPAPQATTAADGTFTLASAPNGHYLLVIGDDTPGQTLTSVVHDQITLTGGSQALVAPTMPPVPTITPPAWETGGAYRIATLNANDKECIARMDADRATRNLPALVEDEWLHESSVQVGAYHYSPSGTAAPWPNNTNGGLADTYGGGSGGTSCDFIADGSFTAGSPLLDPRVQWLGAYYNGNSIVQATSDPVTLPSTKGVVWP